MTVGKMMVCVSGSPFSKELIRTASEMAGQFHQPWFVLYVDSPRMRPKSAEERMNISRNLQFAGELGAEVFTISESSVSTTILTFANKHHVKHLVIGRPMCSKIKEWLHPSIVSQVIQKAGNLTIHVVPGRRETRKNRINYLLPSHSAKWLPYFMMTGVILVMSLFLSLTGLSHDLVNVALLYLLPILFGATYWGIGVAIYTAFLSALSFDYFFVPPIHSFTVAGLRYILSLIIFLIVATLTASLSSRLKNQLIETQQNERIASTLYVLSREMTVENELEPTLKRMITQISDRIGHQTAIYLPDEGNELEILISSTSADEDSLKKNTPIANWVYRNGEMAGWGTQTLSQSSVLYMPIRTDNDIYGVLAIHYGRLYFPESIEHKRMVEAISSLVAMAVARIRFKEEAKKAELAAESEKLGTILLDSISHELRTPLSSIIGSVTALSDSDAVYDAPDRDELLATIRLGAESMNYLITNLLSMVRLESGMLHLNRHWCDLEDMIGVSVRQVKRALEQRDLRIKLDESLPPVYVDEILFEQVLINILGNAIKYSPNSSLIVLTAFQKDDTIKIDVSDQGMGVPRGELDHIFDKFYRLKTTTRISGTGLGLAIAKGIVQAHGGTIKAIRNSGAGLTISIGLSIENHDRIGGEISSL